jgi:hypothetical protein
MVRGLTIAVGIGLIILWIAGLSSPNSSTWLTWLDGIMGLFAFSIAGGLSQYNTRMNTRGARAGGPFMLSLGLFVLWIIAVASGVIAWQTWWTFAFACAELVVAFIGGAQRGRVAQYPGDELERRRRDEEISRRKVS